MLYRVEIEKGALDTADGLNAQPVVLHLPAVSHMLTLQSIASISNLISFAIGTVIYHDGVHVSS